MDSNDTTQNTDGTGQGNNGNQTQNSNGAGQGNEGSGSKFTPITTQEEFEKAFAWRWAREKAKYDDFDKYKASHERLTEVEADLENLRARATAAEKKADEYESTQRTKELMAEIAEKEGIKPNLIPLLTGSTKEEIEESAKIIKAAIGDDTTPYVGSDGNKSGTPGLNEKQKVANALFTPKG